MRYVRLDALPPWVEKLPSESQSVFAYCLGKVFPVDEELTALDAEMIVVDVSAEVDAKFGGFANDLRIEPRYLTFLDGPVAHETLEVRVGSSAANGAIESGLMSYVDERGKTCSINLAGSHRHYLARHVTGKTCRMWDAAPGKRVTGPVQEPPGNKTVGFRKAVSRPPTVRLLSDPDIRFVFESREAAHRLLLDPLRVDGWRTWDRD